jgi:hypothetical protein
MMKPGLLHSPWLRELVVPATILGCIGLFAWDSLHLSNIALILPGVLIVVTVVALLWELGGQWLSRETSIERATNASAPPAEEEDETSGPILDMRPWLVVALPLLLIALFEHIGALATLVLLVFGGQLIFGIRSPLRALLIAVAVTAPTYVLFKYLLYVRFPDGMFGLG